MTSTRAGRSDGGGGAHRGGQWDGQWAGREVGRRAGACGVGRAREQGGREGVPGSHRSRHRLEDATERNMLRQQVQASSTLSDTRATGEFCSASGWRLAAAGWRASGSGGRGEGGKGRGQREGLWGTWHPGSVARSEAQRVGEVKQLAFKLWCQRLCPLTRVRMPGAQYLLAAFVRAQCQLSSALWTTRWCRRRCAWRR